MFLFENKLPFKKATMLLLATVTEPPFLNNVVSTNVTSFFIFYLSGYIRCDWYTRFIGNWSIFVIIKKTVHCETVDKTRWKVIHDVKQYINQFQMLKRCLENVFSVTKIIGLESDFLTLCLNLFSFNFSLSRQFRI